MFLFLASFTFTKPFFSDPLLSYKRKRRLNLIINYSTVCLPLQIVRYISFGPNILFMLPFGIVKSGIFQYKETGFMSNNSAALFLVHKPPIWLKFG